jgi:hypothetical protein
MHTKTDSEKPACMYIDQYVIQYINSDREVETVSETSNFYCIKMWLIVWKNCVLTWKVRTDGKRTNITSVRFQILMATSMKMNTVLYGVASCSLSLHTDDRGSRSLWNYSKFFINSTAQHPRRQSSKYDTPKIYFHFRYLRKNTINTAWKQCVTRPQSSTVILKHHIAGVESAVRSCKHTHVRIRFLSSRIVTEAQTVKISCKEIRGCDKEGPQRSVCDSLDACQIQIYKQGVSTYFSNLLELQNF